MIVLHNSMDGSSRKFVNALLGHTVDANDFTDSVLSEDGHIIYDWYQGGREAWWALSGTDKVSAFPSVVVDVPTHDVETFDEDGPIGQRTAEQVALRMVTTVAEVQSYLDDVNVKLDLSANSLGMTPEILTLTMTNLNDAATGRLTI